MQTLYTISKSVSMKASPFSGKFHTLTTPSQPPVAMTACETEGKRARQSLRPTQTRVGVATTQHIMQEHHQEETTWIILLPVAEPGAAAGAQDTALHPIWCALWIGFSSQTLSCGPRQVRIERVPSAEAAAILRPSSCGANEMLLTED